MSRYEAALVRAGLVYLVLTGVLGASFFIAPQLAGYLRATHVHAGLVGFFLSLVMGVAYWLMPRPGGLRQEGLEAATFYLLNLGLVLRLGAEPFWRASGLEPLRWLLVASGLLQLGAMIVFAFAMQRRVRTKEAILAARRR
jgi:hypothetical protein